MRVPGRYVVFAVVTFVVAAVAVLFAVSQRLNDAADRYHERSAAPTR